MYAEFARIAPALTDGRLSMAAGYDHILASGRLFDDVLPFMAGLRARGIKIAIVSNCDEQARGLLGWLGVTPLADALVLSCEVVAAKPAARIFERALESLEVSAQAALFVDDNPGFCAQAAALGLRTAQISRDGRRADVPAAGATVVRSLAEVEAMLYR